MKALVLGISHNSAPLEIREKLALATGQLPRALLSLHDYVDQGVLLSTCNRTEIYSAEVRPALAERRIINFIRDYFHISPEELSPYLYKHYHRDAVRHLFRVACGIDSMIVGEFEILGQVRHALEEAERAGTVQSPLLNLFRQALRVGRRAREETAISRNAASVSSAGVELARQFFGDLTRCKVLVISAGEAGKLTARALVKTGIAEMTVTSRTYERAVALASRLGGRAIPFHHLKQALSEADIVISCSGSPHFILEPPAIEEAMRSRPERPLFLIDIAVPRDIDPEVKKVSNVLLHDIDDLRMVSEANVREREKEVEKVTALIEAEVTKFMEWWDSLKVVPTITALVNKCESIRQRELAKFISRRSHLSEEDRNQMEILTRSIIKKILHDPILRLKKHGADGKYDQAVRELFKLDEEV